MSNDAAAAADPWTARLEPGEAQRLLLQAYPGAVLLLAADGRVLGLNPAAAERLGHEADAPPEAALRLDEPVQAGSDREWTLPHRDGSARTLRLLVGAFGGGGLIAVERWPREDDEAALRFSHHDAMTGLPTSAVLADRADMALQRAARQQKTVALLLIEIAGFDALCETHGRSVGDDVLRAVASRLHFELRKTDTATRLDGGQFALLLVDLHRPEEATPIAEKLREALAAPINVGVALLEVAPRIGIAWSPAHGDQLLPLMQAAEAALGGVDAERGGIAHAAA